MQVFSDHEKIICIANSNKDVIETINKFNSDKQFKIIDKKDLNSFLYSFVNMKNEGYNIIENILKYYLNIKNFV